MNAAGWITNSLCLNAIRETLARDAAVWRILWERYVSVCVCVSERECVCVCVCLSALCKCVCLVRGEGLETSPLFQLSSLKINMPTRTDGRQQRVQNSSCRAEVT